MATRFSPPAPTYLGPAKFHGGAQRITPLKRIVIHGTVSACVPGGARAIANYFRKTVTRPSSAHYVIDPLEVVQVVGDHQIAFHAPPNTDTIGVEHCDPVAGPAARWSDANHSAMLRLSAETVARLCLAYDLPIRRVGPVGLRLGRRGITGHADVSKAWKQTTHTDPGADFPWRLYLDLVQRAADDLRAAATPPPVVKPLPPKLPTVPGIRMTVVTANIRNTPDLPRDQVRADTLAVKQLGGVLLWQEIAEQDDRDDLTHSCPPERWMHVGMNTECPMSFYRSKWTVRASGNELLHGGKAGVSPARYVTWAEVIAKGQDPDLIPPVVVMNTHWVSGGFSNPGQQAEEWRRAQWNVAHLKQTALVARFLAAGRTVIGGGDFNRTGEWTGFAPQHRWLMHGGYDHLWTCEAQLGAKVRLEKTGTLGTDHLFTDHPARWSAVTLHPVLTK